MHIQTFLWVPFSHANSTINTISLSNSYHGKLQIMNAQPLISENQVKKEERKETQTIHMHFFGKFFNLVKDILCTVKFSSIS